VPKIEIQIGEVPYALLEVLARGEFGCGTVKAVIEELIYHAQQGV